MKLQIRQYKYEKKEIASEEIEIPTTISYYFETGVRRSIKIIPHFTTWNIERFNKEEELYELKIICVYNSNECKIENFSIRVGDIEKIYHNIKHKYNGFVVGLVDNWFDERTKEQFNNDLNAVIKQINEN